MDKYYHKRYRHVINTVQFIYSHSISGIEKQTDLFVDIDFRFELGYYRLESHPK
jgi:hypothetical protein